MVPCNIDYSDNDTIFADITSLPQYDFDSIRYGVLMSILDDIICPSNTISYIYINSQKAVIMENSRLF